MDAVASAMRDHVRARVRALAGLGVDAIALLPQYLDLTDSRAFTVSQYHDAVEAGAHLVVVQACRPRTWGLFTAIEIDGFVMTAQGTRRGLTESETWPFT